MSLDDLTFPSRTSQSRRRVLATLLLAPLAALPAIAIARSHPPRVLFICQFGSVKSAIARELFRRRAAERGIAAIAVSRGIQPEAHLDPRLHDLLAGQGIDPARDGQHKLSRGDLRRADYTVLLDKLPPGWIGRNPRDWTDLGSFNQSYVTEEPRVKARIDQLLDEIAARAHYAAGAALA